MTQNGSAGGTVEYISCGFEDPSQEQAALASLSMDYETLYSSAENIAALSKALKEARGQEFCILPFCHTLEAEALGANVVYGDSTAGARAGEPAFASTEEIEAFARKEAEQSDGPVPRCRMRLERTLDACALLVSRGERVVFTMSGPFSTLSCLMDLAKFFKEQRKSPEKTQQFFDFLSGFLMRQARRIKDAGAFAVSFADPAGSLKVLGPRYSAIAAQSFDFPFLLKFAEEFKGSPAMLLCPVTAQGLLKYADEKAPELRAGLLESARICCIKGLKTI